MATVKELFEKRNVALKAINDLRDAITAGEGREFTAEEQTNWDKANKDYDGLSKQIEVCQRAEKLTASQNEPTGDRLIGRDDVSHDRNSNQPGDEDRATVADAATVFGAWVRSNNGIDITDKEIATCRRFGINPARDHITISRPNMTQRFRDAQALYRNVHPTLIESRQVANKASEDRNMSAFAVASGGALYGEGFMPRLETALLQYGGMLQSAEIIRTAGGEPMPWPNWNDTSNKGARIGENTSIGSSVDPSTGQTIFNAYKYYSKPILVPYELLQDSVFNLGQQIEEALAIRIGRILNDETTTTSTTGGACPIGIFDAATTGKTAASTTAIAADEIIDLIHSVDPAYREMPGVGFMMHDTVLAAVRKLKDGFGNYLWQGGLQMCVPDKLLGYGLTINQSANSTFTTTKKMMAFGLLSKYKIRFAGDIRLYRLEERYRDLDQTGFVAYLRADGNLVDAGTHPVKTYVLG